MVKVAAKHRRRRAHFLLSGLSKKFCWEMCASSSEKLLQCFKFVCCGSDGTIAMLHGARVSGPWKPTTPFLQDDPDQSQIRCRGCANRGCQKEEMHGMIVACKNLKSPYLLVTLQSRDPRCHFWHSKSERLADRQTDLSSLRAHFKIGDRSYC